MDERKVDILLFLDLSAAFDTVDHKTLLDRLRGELGVDDIALDWFKSYIADRQQVVTIRGEESDSCRLNFGVPQGSVPRPQLIRSVHHATR